MLRAEFVWHSVSKNLGRVTLFAAQVVRGDSSAIKLWPKRYWFSRSWWCYVPCTTEHKVNDWAFVADKHRQLSIVTWTAQIRLPLRIAWLKSRQRGVQLSRHQRSQMWGSSLNMRCNFLWLRQSCQAEDVLRSNSAREEKLSFTRVNREEWNGVAAGGTVSVFWLRRKCSCFAVSGYQSSRDAVIHTGTCPPRRLKLRCIRRMPISRPHETVSSKISNAEATWPVVSTACLPHDRMRAEVIALRAKGGVTLVDLQRRFATHVFRTNLQTCYTWSISFGGEARTSGCIKQ